MGEENSNNKIASVDEQTKTLPSKPKKKFLGIDPLKLVFALEYVLQGSVAPFQGITYQPFFNHFRNDYGLSEAATQGYFSKAYLAWSFKPIMGFIIDAIGKTKFILIALLSFAIFIYFITPIIDTSATVFFGMMFVLSIVLAATDVTVDRATVVEGEEEARCTGKSKSTTVGLNQAICWTAIYGTLIISMMCGGYIADHFKMKSLIFLLPIVPIILLIAVLRLPKDKSSPIPFGTSIKNFWCGLNTGPILWIIVFYFLFHFQPAMGALWTNHLIENLHFSQTQVGIGDGVQYFGFFVGVIIFAELGIKWQEVYGLKKVFKIFILGSILINLTQYLLVEPWFSKVTDPLAGLFPFLAPETTRLIYLSFYNFVYAVVSGLIRMSTFSLVGAVIPINAAGSLFAGFMSVANLAYSFSYSSGAWLYDNGLNFGILRSVQEGLFGIKALPGTEMSISLLILIGSAAYILSFLAAHALPDKRQTQCAEDDKDYLVGPEHFNVLGKSFLKVVNISSVFFILILLALSIFVCKLDVISSSIISFFIAIFLRKVFLDISYKRAAKKAVSVKG